MKEFPKREINAAFMADVMRHFSAPWQKTSRSIGRILSADLFFVANFQSSSSPTRAGFRVWTGVGSKRLDTLSHGRSKKIPNVHVGEAYVPQRQPNGLGHPGEDWVILTKIDHIDAQSSALVEYIFHRYEQESHRSWDYPLLLAELKRCGNPFILRTLEEFLKEI